MDVGQMKEMQERRKESNEIILRLYWDFKRHEDIFLKVIQKFDLILGSKG